MPHSQGSERGIVVSIDNRNQAPELPRRRGSRRHRRYDPYGNWILRLLIRPALRSGRSLDRQANRGQLALALNHDRRYHFSTQLIRPMAGVESVWYGCRARLPLADSALGRAKHP